MRRSIDVHNALVPALAAYPTFWAEHGIVSSNATEVLRFATGELFVNQDRAAWLIDARNFARDVGECGGDALIEEFAPERVLQDLTLARQPGLILLEAGTFSVPLDVVAARLCEGLPGSAALVREWTTQNARDGRLAITRPLHLYSGQRLRGIGSLEHGSWLHWGDGDALLLEGEGASLEGVLLTGEGNGIGIRASGAEHRIEACEVRGFRTAARLTGARHFVVHRSTFQATEVSLDCDSQSPSVSILGSWLLSDRLALRMAGSEGKVVRSRIERVKAGGEVQPATPLIAVEADGCMVAGCGLVAQHLSGPAITVGSGVRETLFENNVHRLWVEPDPGRLPAEPAPGLIIDDRGTSTLFRDPATAGFPSVSLSTHTLLANGDFSAWSVDPLSRPLAWALEGALWLWRSRPAFADGAAGPFIGRGETPEGPVFGDWAAGEFNPAQLFEKTSEVHAGPFSLWLGLRRLADRDAQTVVIKQEVPVSATAREFVLSGFIKARRVGIGSKAADAWLELTDNEGRTSRSRAYSGNGGWQQRTVRYVAGEPSSRSVTLTVRCGLSSGNRDAVEAFFGRLMLVAGAVVPQYADQVMTDAGGATGHEMQAKLGRWVTARLAQDRPLAVVGRAFELTEDLLLRLPATGGLTFRGLVGLDVLRNGQSIFLNPIQGVQILRQADLWFVASVPLTAVSPSHRTLQEGDLLSLKASEPIELVLAGRSRSI